ncbi:cell division protease FtsH [Clostridium acetobutylicum]|uniref:ATP-dependent Zn protease n=1 Tax=Clostridium acetobutylicum (strain ATCC 824 / DSM 792 / JCM 1419 / IAM 19013 / LMG 5710 / NBRC 13948 / NRRL B-527 / VKM B-1787 / 2291 / W) TaxID=272562 RepID=Q97KG4_CLOAB|nr:MULTISPECIES: ATP-dependent metallopeptidase FtsH/Yme1/Tma family protein [Clostridium]AAK78931.1 ATP-dependent Zn protease [Clostridium acetobutylicum ATCC 824]ADZ20006.1 ATP-dependent Zn protease [Clostridium acetobutylicum EA 2018]AEI33482.1 ATP-dependent Zn protease [Clostridium acetobutylicum DSM 1731]AWV80650.1 ATP-dependent metallopeptidase FtsH/Yme1/Tma family protein [Clostridium acetobutylicum]MBC2396105.1 ATP-dependent metallopeptidase FtsH/Yme1/Tma family protein [Clostridium ac
MKYLKNKHFIVPAFIFLCSLTLFASSLVSINKTQYKMYINFEKDIKANKVETVYLTSSPKITVQLKSGSVYTTDNPRTDNFKENLLKNSIKVSEDDFKQSKSTVYLLILAISTLYFITSLIKVFKISIPTKKAFAVDKLETDSIENVGVKFNDVAGNEEAKESVQDIIDFLKNPEKYNLYGARMPKGVILYGEPGTGKTMLAKAIAGEANVPFYAMSGSDFIQVYVGVGASRIRQLFKKARSNGKAVIFIDEIDAIGKKRDGGKSGGSEERDQTLNALLTEMSGFKEKEGIVVIAATNRIDVLDSALLRPGRFDRHIEINLPDISARKKILSLLVKNKPVKDIDLNDLAQKTAYFSGAKLENLVNEAAILACKENSSFIENQHMDKAFSIVIAGYEKVDRSHISLTDKKITAYHESGHALVSLKVLPEEKVSKITIIPSTNGSGGYTLSIPEDKMYQNKEYIQNRIRVLLGGRAAEEIIFGKSSITTGAYNDLQKVTSAVTKLVTQYGMGSSLGLLNADALSEINYSVSTSVIDECKDLVETLYEDTKNILLNNKHILENMSNKLLDVETLNYEDIQGLNIQ